MKRRELTLSNSTCAISEFPGFELDKDGFLELLEYLFFLKTLYWRAAELQLLLLIWRPDKYMVIHMGPVLGSSEQLSALCGSSSSYLPGSWK
jgi:hypothetical protein